MNNTGIKLIHWRDIPAALGLLTRLPVPVNTQRAVTRGAAAAWAYPVAGIIVGVLLATAAQLGLWIGLPDAIIAGLLLVVSAVLTGAMHEDGLADTADGLWGGWDRDRRLAIMKDSHIGVYGVVTICLSLLLRWLALVPVIAIGVHWSVLIAIAVLSRTTMVGVMTALPNARDTGLSHTVGRPSLRTAMFAVVIAVVVAVLCQTFYLLWATVLTGTICAAIAKAKIGGQTGDILGASQQVTEIVLLLTLLTALT